MNRFSFIVSDESVNKYGYRVLSSGIDTEEFKKNPVMFWNHLRDDEFNDSPDRMPIGKWENLRVEDDKLIADAVLDMNDETGRKVAQKLKDGFLNAASIGIGVLEMSDRSELIHEGQSRPTITKSVLQEISIVDIPANSNAMRLSFAGQSLTLSAGMDMEKLNSIMPEIKKTETLGAAIGGNLDRLVDEYAEANEMTKAEALDAFGDAAGISGDTVSNIISGDIDCPPMERLEGFAQISGTPVSDWEAWKAADGCETEEEMEEEEMENATDEAAEQLEELRKGYAELKAAFDAIEIPEQKDHSEELQSLRGDLEAFKTETATLKTELSAANETIQALRGELIALKGKGSQPEATGDTPVLGFGSKATDNMTEAFRNFGNLSLGFSKKKNDFK